MQEKITFSQLCSLVSTRSAVPRKVTEEYLRAFFAAVSDGLESSDTVKIKGLGTFKTTRIAERRSVNVTTGQEMVIPAHQRITFTPAVSMAQAVNAPFAAFEAVELADDFTDADLAALDNPDEPQEDSEQEGDLPLVDTDVPAAPVAAVQEAEDDAGFEEILPPPRVTIVPPSVPEEPEEREVATPPALPDTADQQPPMVSPAMEETEEREETTPPALPDTADQQPPILSPAMEEPETVVYEDRKKRFGFWGGFCSALALVAVIAGVIILFWPNLLSISQSPVKTKTKTAAVVPPTVPKDTAQLPIDEEAEKQSLMPVTTPGEEAQAAQEDAAPVYDTITKTRYLTTMAKEHYGNYHFWPYIYEENKAFLGHPDRIKPGTRVVVPPLSKYGVDPSNPDDVSEAKKKGVAIYARYQK